jgi:uncharacterized protein
MNLYDHSVLQFVRVIGQVPRWLDKAAAHATAKKFDVELLVAARLAPDQYPLVAQIQSASDAAKFCSAYLAGVVAPRFPDVEKTLPELRERLDKTIAFLQTIKPEQLEGAAERVVRVPWMPGKGLKGADYLTRLALPNFYFHVTTAYAILRHNGVDLGKQDFIADLPFIDV